MSNTPTDRSSERSEDAALNPALKQVHDETYGTHHEATDPMSTVSVQKDEGTWWPYIWAGTAVIGVIIAAILIIF